MDEKTVRQVKLEALELGRKLGVEAINQAWAFTYLQLGCTQAEIIIAWEKVIDEQIKSAS